MLLSIGREKGHISISSDWAISRYNLFSKARSRNGDEINSKSIHDSMFRIVMVQRERES